MARFDRFLEKIGNKITIKDEDREPYTRNFEIIRDYVLRRMCLYDSNFSKIYRGTSLFGSYSNNVRICYPSEFDVHVLLSFPFTYCIDVEEDDERPGFVNLDFSDVMEKLEEHNGYDDIKECLEDIVDWKNGYLRRSNLQNWICDIITGALEDADIIRGVNGDKYQLIYSKRGLAHTIYAAGRYTVSIDLVPAIMFGQKEWMDIPSSHLFTYKCDRWYAVPKPTFGPKSTRRYAFMICNPKVEHDLLLGRQNLKVVFRLLKSLRKKYGMRYLKSYFITTAFLWEIEKQPNRFWYNSISYILIHMLDVISDYFLDGKLPFFWNEDLDLFEALWPSEIEEYADKLCNIYNILKSYPYQPQLSFQRCESHFKIP